MFKTQIDRYTAYLISQHSLKLKPWYTLADNPSSVFTQPFIPLWFGSAINAYNIKIYQVLVHIVFKY